MGVPFCNTLHVDRSDLFDPTTSKKVLQSAHDHLSNNDVSQSEVDKCKYIIAFYKEYGRFSAGTRVTYHFVYKNEYEYNNIEVLQYFILLDDMYLKVLKQNLSVTFFPKILTVVKTPLC